MKLFSVMLILALISCSEKAHVQDKETEFVFEDGFETNGNDLDELFPNNGSRWSNIQQVNPNNGANQIAIVQNTVLNGKNALRIFARPSDDILSKMDIEKGGLSTPEGSTIIIEANFFIVGAAGIKDLLLMDLECCSCWDPDVPDNKCPGVRLVMNGDTGYLSIERGKIAGNTIVQPDFAFPRNEWVNVVWEMTLSPNEDGVNKLTINGTEVILKKAMNMPNADVFNGIFAAEGIDFELQQPFVYERLQIGITANPTKAAVLMFVDDVKIEIF